MGSLKLFFFVFFFFSSSCGYCSIKTILFPNRNLQAKSNFFTFFIFNSRINPHLLLTSSSSFFFFFFFFNSRINPHHLLTHSIKAGQHRVNSPDSGTKEQILLRPSADVIFRAVFRHQKPLYKTHLRCIKDILKSSSIALAAFQNASRQRVVAIPATSPG